jgi:hypothetical protein
MPKKLSHGEKHMLRLIARDANQEGWTEVSAAVMPHMESLPQELIDLEDDFPEKTGCVRLTQTGREIVSAMEWL